MNIADVERLVVHAGETLLVSVPDGTSGEKMRDLRQAVIERVPDGVTVMVVTESVRFKVISNESARTDR